MNRKQIEALIYVNRHGTFKKAAEAIYFESAGDEYITPESIQYRVKQLEQELGVTLYRKKQGSTQVRITREGQLFLKEAVDVYSRMMEWRDLFLERPGGLLTLAATQTVLINRIHGVIERYHRLYPDVTIRAHNSHGLEMEQMVAEGRIDFAISTRPPSDSDLEYVLWMRTDLVVVTPKGHPLTKKKKVTVEEVAEYPLVLLEPEPHSDREKLDQAFRDKGIRKLNIVFETSNSEILLAYVESGMGVTITSETSLVRNQRKVDHVPLADNIGRSEVGVLVRRGQYLPGKVREFLRLLDPRIDEWLRQRDTETVEAPSEPRMRKRRPRLPG
ncbi:MAG: LysR family transcriptional regulator [Candidatus Sumerlaeia bacterium]|nr:LysR family transcriptional regulator [Candidatus Sumerlaeia bacterium]